MNNQEAGRMRYEEAENAAREAAKKVLAAYPAAILSLGGALDRLNAPFHVRLWHQWKGHEGWGHGYRGCGSELDLVKDAAIFVAVFGSFAILLWLMS